MQLPFEPSTLEDHSPLRYNPKASTHPLELFQRRSIFGMELDVHLVFQSSSSVPTPTQTCLTTIFLRSASRRALHTYCVILGNLNSRLFVVKRPYKNLHILFTEVEE